MPGRSPQKLIKWMVPPPTFCERPQVRRPYGTFHVHSLSRGPSGPLCRWVGPNIPNSFGAVGQGGEPRPPPSPTSITSHCVRPCQRPSSSRIPMPPCGALAVPSRLLESLPFHSHCSLDYLFLKRRGCSPLDGNFFGNAFPQNWNSSLENFGSVDIWYRSAFSSHGVVN